jgi:gluconolactonase
VTLSPDESRLYLADTSRGDVFVYDVAADGSLSNRTRFAADAPGADGMAMDVQGNLYVTTTGGVAVYAPDGARRGTIPVAQQPANAAFGGADRRTLYITARTGLYRVRLPLPGF